MKLNDDINIVLLIISGALIYHLFSRKNIDRKPLYKGFSEDKSNLSSDWNQVYNDYNKSYNKIANE